MDRVFIPIMRYVGGEDYEVIERDVRDADATPKQLRSFLAHGFEQTGFNRAFARSVTNGAGAANREFRRLERFQRKAEQRLWLILKRKGS